MKLTLAAITAGALLGLLFLSGPSDQEIAEATYQYHVDARKAALEDARLRRAEHIFQERAK